MDNNDKNLLKQDVSSANIEEKAVNDDRPENVPEKFWDPKTKSIRTEALLKSYSELEKMIGRSTLFDPEKDERSKLYKMFGVPEKAEDYAPDVEKKPFERDMSMEQRLHEKGFNQEQLQEIYDLAEEKLVPLVVELAREFEADREVERLVNHFGSEEQWQEVSRQLYQFGSKHLPQEAFKGLSSSFEGVLALYNMMKNNEGLEFASSSDAGYTSGANEDELKSMMKDPRYWREKDPAFVKKVTDGYKALYNE